MKNSIKEEIAIITEYGAMVAALKQTWDSRSAKDERAVRIRAHRVAAEVETALMDSDDLSRSVTVEFGTVSVSGRHGTEDEAKASLRILKAAAKKVARDMGLAR